MAIDWLRLWHDMPTDPKFRVVAKRAGRPLSEVVAVFVVMLTNASANAENRGTLSNWSDEDVAAALDMEPENVAAIFRAMQGKTLEGEKLSGWEKRQPQREDGGAERAKAWRERNRTQANAGERTETLREDQDKDKEKNLEPRAGVREIVEEGVNSLNSKGGKGGVSPTLQGRAEGLGLNVSRLLATTMSASPKNADAYFRKLCRNELSKLLPKASDDLLNAALSRNSDGAFATVCALLVERV
jgi:hypothetical protein